MEKPVNETCEVPNCFSQLTGQPYCVPRAAVNKTAFVV